MPERCQSYQPYGNDDYFSCDDDGEDDDADVDANDDADADGRGERIIRYSNIIRIVGTEY